MKAKHIFQTAIAAAALLFGNDARAQDIHFSQFYLSPLTQNPALSGAQHDMRAVVNYKNQWQSIGSPYRTTGFSYDLGLNRKKGGKGFFAAGVNFFSDRAGDAKMGTAQGNLSLAYHVRMGGNSTLGGGLQAGFAQRSITGSALQWGNQYDGSMYNAALPSNEPGAANFSYLDLGGGVLWNYDNRSGSSMVTDNHELKATLGAAMFHVTEPDYSFYGTGEKLYRKLVVHGNALLSIPNSNVAFAPGFMYYRQGPAQEIYAGSLIRYTISQDSKYTGFKEGAAFSAGAFFRAKDALVISTLLEYSNYSLGLSYDVNVSSLQTASNSRGGLEIALRFVTPNPFQAGKGSRSSFN